MLQNVFGLVRHALMITSFVFVMMLVIEYLNVLTQGAWQQRLTRHRWGQYFLAALLGATPGCLGAFAVVAMYSHGVLTLGAVVTAMIATSGDEAFVMLAMIPSEALLLFGGLFAAGILAGVLTDFIAGKARAAEAPGGHAFRVHEVEHCECFPRGRLLRQWRECSPARGVLAAVLAVLIFAVATGWVGPVEWNWIRVTAISISVVALFIVSTVPDHFLEEHLWRHVARKHVLSVFLWTVGALLAMYVVTEHLQLEGTMRRGQWVVLVIACLVGLVPESGPHLVFVTLFAEGTVPFSVLLASSIVQDGHGMLPMLAETRRGFFQVKAINLTVGLLCGATLMALNL